MKNLNPPAPPAGLAYYALLSVARDSLSRHGEVALGDLFRSLMDEERIVHCGKILGAFREVSCPLPHLSAEEVVATYELVLLVLEGEYGPLICEEGLNTDSSSSEPGAQWGWATPLGQGPLPENMFTRVLLRFEALKQGHPDGNRDVEAGELPGTVWRPKPAIGS